VNDVQFFLRQGDQTPSGVFQLLREDDDEPIDLTGAFDVELRLSRVDAPAPNPWTLGGPTMILDPLLGVVEYQWGPDDTALPGELLGNFVVTWIDGRQASVPNVQAIRIRVAPQLGSDPTTLAGHIMDPEDAHDASAISYLPAPGMSVDIDNVQAALDLLWAQKQAATDEVWVGPIAPDAPSVMLWYDTDDPSPPSGLTGITSDTGETYKIILFSDGTMRAIPTSAIPPTNPTGLTRTVRVNSVKLTWTAVAGATSYRIERDGAPYATSPTTSYRDSGVVVGTTYAYAVRAVDTYGQASPLSATVTAFIDPALNVAPTITVRTWPAGAIPANQRAIVRVNATDVDLQALALALGVDLGTLVATADPTVWNLVPAP
jgi:chitodextrinase